MPIALLENLVQTTPVFTSENDLTGCNTSKKQHASDSLLSKELWVQPKGAIRSDSCHQSEAGRTKPQPSHVQHSYSCVYLDLFSYLILRTVDRFSSL